MDAAPQSACETPLRAREAAEGAQFATWFGCTMPDRFAAPDTEYRQARESAALIDKNYRAYIYATGPDRVRYLNAVLTNDVREAAKGRGVPSLLLNPQGHILAELEIYDLGDKFLLVSYQMIRDHLIETLDKYIIMDDVTLEDATPQLAALSVEGPRAPEILRQLTGIDFDSLAELAVVGAGVHPRPPFGPYDPATIPARIIRRSPSTPGFEVIVAREHLDTLWDTLLAAVRAHDGGPIGYATLSALRLEAGVPWFGYDFDDTVIPHEAGLEISHISYAKGCYTGQEIVERVRSRGQVNRVRAAVEVAGSTIPERGTKLTAAGKEVGHITRAAFSPAAGYAIAMAYLRRDSATPGTPLESATGAAKVITLPLAR